ncbi:hypothetical protein [Burkholderia sp. PU8-34]
MDLLLSAISKVAALIVVAYVIYSVHAAIWVSSRHEGRYFHLEFQPRRARGNTEREKLKRLRRFMYAAGISLIVLFISSFTMLLT